MSQCPNCSAELGDEYCARCGQRRIDPQELSARHFLSELTDAITDFRSRFKTGRTLGLLLIPGALTETFLAGRRKPYLGPFKLYLVCAAFFFLSAPVAGFTLASMLDDDRSGVLRQLASARAAKRHLDPAFFNARFDIRVQSVYTVTLGAAAVVFALMLQALFRRHRWPFGAHLVFAAHYVSVMYLVTVAAGLSRRIGLSIDLAALGGYVVILPYLVVALKRVYAESAAATAWKGAVLTLLTFVLNDLASALAIRLTLALV
jgi:Protein of unknown function (DUF3667)